MALGPFLCMHRMVHCSSPQTEGIQSSREACPWHGAHLNSTLACKTYRLSLLKPLHNVRLSLQKISRYLPKGRKKMAELHVCKVKRIFITYFWTSKVDIKWIIWFLKIYHILLFVLDQLLKSVLPRPPHPPKVETVKNHLFQDHHILQIWKLLKISSSKTTTFTQSRNC